MGLESSNSEATWQVNLDIFEGPLDLLLHLINELEIDIYDIPIAQITTQYLSYIKSSNVMALDTGGQYIVMAATLMSIKSQMLVPRNDEFEDIGADFLEDGEDPREHLMTLLIQYRQFKELANELAEKENERSVFISKPQEDISNYQENIPLRPGEVSLEDLQHAFHKVINERALKEPVVSRIDRKEISVSDKMTQIMAELSDKPVTFQSLFEKETRYELVTSFLAVLELIKANQIYVKQSTIFDDILITKWESQEGSDE